MNLYFYEFVTDNKELFFPFQVCRSLSGSCGSLPIPCDLWRKFFFYYYNIEPIELISFSPARWWWSPRWRRRTSASASTTSRMWTRSPSRNFWSISRWEMGGEVSNCLALLSRFDLLSRRLVNFRMRACVSDLSISNISTPHLKLVFTLINCFK